MSGRVVYVSELPAYASRSFAELDFLFGVNFLDFKDPGLALAVFRAAVSGVDMRTRLHRLKEPSAYLRAGYGELAVYGDAVATVDHGLYRQDVQDIDRVTPGRALTLIDDAFDALEGL